MGAVEIPVTSVDPHSFFSTVLEEVTYGFEFIWNVRDEFWYMSLYDVNETPLVSGKRVVLNVPLLAAYRWNPNIPPGQLVAVDTSGQELEAGLNDLGNRVKLIYFDSTEFA